jgi:hypothetical protein
MENQNPQNRRITRHFIRDAAGTKRTAVQKMKANDMAHSFLRMQKTGAKMFLIGEVVPPHALKSNSLRNYIFYFQ